MDCHTHFNSSGHSKRSLALNEPTENVFFLIQTFTLPPSMHPKLTEHEIYTCCMHNNPLPIKRHVELDNNSMTSSRELGVLHTKPSTFDKPFGCMLENIVKI